MYRVTFIVFVYSKVRVILNAIYQKSQQPKKSNLIILDLWLKSAFEMLYICN